MFSDKQNEIMIIRRNFMVFIIRDAPTEKKSQKDK